MADNLASTLCYVLGVITGILFLVLEPYSKNRKVRFHAFQSIFFSVAVFVIVSAVNIIVGGALGAMGLWVVAGAISSLIGLGVFILWIYLMVMAFQGKDVELPLIGPLARKQA